MFRESRHELIYHDPDWVAAPIRINAQGDTKPGFLCIHKLENGNGWCGRSTLNTDYEFGRHSCVVKKRGWPNISRGCYDKYRRCPGWAGGGWKYAKNKYCREGGLLSIDYHDRWWRWKIQHCPKCRVAVLPYMFQWTSPRSWWYGAKMFCESIRQKLDRIW